jgi:nicotinamide phosphoribosyltransferase
MLFWFCYCQSACWYAQYRLNEGRPVGQSIPATEHSVMTSWRSEREAIQNMIDHFGREGAVFACVMDSYDYDIALTKVLPQVADAHKKKGGMMVLRPDSGDPVECIVKALKAGEESFGAKVNAAGYKVLNGVSAIQGDGINFAVVKEILKTTLDLGYSAQNVAFGMGGGLLQKVDRDTMSFATKLSYIIYSADGKHRNVMKRPKTDGGKFSLPGILQVRRNSDHTLTVLPREYNEKVDPRSNVLKVVYDCGPVDYPWENFDQLRHRVETEWSRTPRLHDPIGNEMKKKVKDWIQGFDIDYAVMLADLETKKAEVTAATAAAAVTNGPSRKK